MFDADVAIEFRRSVVAALEGSDPVSSRTALIDAGWLDALAADEAMAVAVVFGEQGRAVRDAAALDDVLAHHLDTGDLAVAYPVAPNLHVVMPAHRHARRLLWIPDLRGEGLLVVAVDDVIGEHSVGGIDPAAGFWGLTARPAGPTSAVAAADWPAALAAGRVAVATQMVAAARTLLSAAVAHARQRTQFGTPIATFQAVKHRLADTLVAISAAEAVTFGAATCPTATGAVLAKVLAGKAAEVASRNCLQVFGGIGFTTEHQFHHYYRRALVLDRLLGDYLSLERELGAALRAGSLADQRLVDIGDVPRWGVGQPLLTRSPRRRG